MSLPGKRSKYGVRTDAKGKADRTVDGIVFDSKKEANRYCVLRLMEKCKVIRGLNLQPTFDLIVEGISVGTYRGDFGYYEKSGKGVVEDVKGMKTAVYRLKKKLMKAIYGIEILET